jgi:hypothetical protein
VASRHLVNVNASILVAECRKCWLTAGELTEGTDLSPVADVRGEARKVGADQHWLA